MGKTVVPLRDDCLETSDTSNLGMISPKHGGKGGKKKMANRSHGARHLRQVDPSGPMMPGGRGVHENHKKEKTEAWFLEKCQIEKN